MASIILVAASPEVNIESFTFDIAEINEDMQEKLQTVYADAYKLSLTINSPDIRDVVLGLDVINQAGEKLVCMHPQETEAHGGVCHVGFPKISITLEQGMNSITVWIKRELLREGEYDINVAVWKALTNEQINSCKERGIAEELCDCIGVRDETMTDRTERDKLLATDDFCGSEVDEYRYFYEPKIGTIAIEEAEISITVKVPEDAGKPIEADSYLKLTCNPGTPDEKRVSGEVISVTGPTAGYYYVQFELTQAQLQELKNAGCSW
jgi:hypothetical protein